MNPYCRLIPRLNGAEIEERFGYYRGLVGKGIAGFILFGGELGAVRAAIAELQRMSSRPLLICSDLEQGLGQQLEGGTLFPPAMAVASAIRDLDEPDAQSLLKRLYAAFAVESVYAGIHTIFAPVLDINTNPRNPIIATRAFGEDRATVSRLGCRMIRTLQQNGVISCGKHFPGHGNTEVDSHVGLPVINKDMRWIENHELVPFQRAIDAGVGMVMLGHLSVPALDPSGIPASISGKIVSYLRETMGFKGLIITDAMNMGGLGGFGEDEASFMALKAGVDLILHPTDPDRTASYLLGKKCVPPPLALDLHIAHPAASVDFEEHRRLSGEIARRAIRVEGTNMTEIRKPFVIILDEDRGEREFIFIDALRERYPDMRYHVLLPGDEMPWQEIPKNSGIIVALFSTVRAWKTANTQWLAKTLDDLSTKATVFISFGNPYLFHHLPGDVTKISAFWASEAAQKAVAERL